MPKAGLAEWNEEDAFDLHDERPSRHARRKRLPWWRMGVLSCLCIAVLVFMAHDPERMRPSAEPRPVPLPALVAPVPAWRPISPHPPLYAFERNADPVALTARQHSNGAREDTLILGRFGEPRHAQIALAYGPAEPPRSFFVDLVRRSAQAGLSVARIAQSERVDTKFGAMEAASVTLAGDVESSCLAFRFADPDAPFRLHGWLCGSEERPVDETRLACLIDGIGLAGGADAGLKAVFARSEHSRIEICGADGRAAAAAVRTPSRP